jgi:putative ABC transport system permease protein
MIRHIFKMMWNRKKANVLIILEIFFAFLVLFALLSFVYYNLRNYLQPLGFSYDNVFRVAVTNFGVNNGDEDAQRRLLNQLKTAIASLEGTEYVSRCSENTPYENSTWTSSSDYTENGRRITINAHTAAVDEDFHTVWDLTLIEGRWFDQSDSGARFIPIVINQTLARHLEKMYGNTNTIGRVLHEHYKVIGVIQDYRYRGEFHKPFQFYFFPLQNAHKVNNAFVIKTRPNAGVGYEERLAKMVHNIAKSWTVKIKPVEQLRKSYWQKTLSPIIGMSIVAGFLLLNVALGIFGVLWYTITRRRSEIGLRKALGAFASKISGQIVGEALALTTLGLLMGYIVAFQFPLMNVFNISRDIYGVAILISTLFMYALVAICSFYPSRLAAKIEPVVALHEE